MWRELHGHVWHSTSSHLVPAIIAAGEIQSRPSLYGEDYVWAKNHTTFCRARDCVSVLDFANADWKVAFRANRETEWLKFLGPRGIKHPSRADAWRSTVWFAVNWRSVAGYLSPPEALVTWEATYSHQWMPGIEGCHPSPIRLLDCSHAVIVCAVERKDFQRVAIGPSMLDEIRELQSGWLKKHAGKYDALEAERTEAQKEALLRACAGGASDKSETRRREKQNALRENVMHLLGLVQD